MLAQFPGVKDIVILKAGLQLCALAEVRSYYHNGDLCVCDVNIRQALKVEDKGESTSIDGCVDIKYDFSWVSIASISTVVDTSLCLTTMCIVDSANQLVQGPAYHRA